MALEVEALQLLDCPLAGMGPLITEGRRSRGWTQAELADRLDVSRETVSHWERGSQNPTTQHAVFLFQLLEKLMSRQSRRQFLKLLGGAALLTQLPELTRDRDAVTDAGSGRDSDQELTPGSALERLGLIRKTALQGDGPLAGLRDAQQLETELASVPWSHVSPAGNVDPQASILMIQDLLEQALAMAEAFLPNRYADPHAILGLPHGSLLQLLGTIQVKIYECGLKHTDPSRRAVERTLYYVRGTAVRALDSEIKSARGEDRKRLTSVRNDFQITERTHPLQKALEGAEDYGDFRTMDPVEKVWVRADLMKWWATEYAATGDRDCRKKAVQLHGQIESELRMPVLTRHALYGYCKAMAEEAWARVLFLFGDRSGEVFDHLEVARGAENSEISFVRAETTSCLLLASDPKTRLEASDRLRSLYRRVKDSSTSDHRIWSVRQTARTSNMPEAIEGHVTGASRT